MDNEKEYITITQVAKELGWNKATVYDWIKTLEMEKHRFVRNKNTFLHIDDFERLKEIKAKPWTAGPNTARTARSATEKDEKQPSLPSAKEAKDAAIKAAKRTYTRKKDTGLPEGCVLATDFAKAHGVEPRTFYDHMVLGLGPGTVPGEMGDPMLPVKEQVDYSERDKSGRKGERERYLTPAQQKAALDFWKRHGVAFTVPESEQEAPADESWWNEPGAE